MTKPKCLIWNYFRKIIDERTGTERFKCKFCDALYQKNATRQKNHLLKCKFCPDAVKNILNKKGILTNFVVDVTEIDGNELQNQEVTKPSTDDENAGPSTVTTPKTGNEKPTLKKFLDSMSKEEQISLDELAARAIYATAAPLSMFENEYWIKFFSKLRPSWKPPSAYILSHLLLEKEFLRVQNDVFTKISNAKAVGIQCDGWSNRRNEAVINVIVSTPDAVLYKTLATEEKSHTGEYLAKIMLEVIEEIGSHKVLAVVTDNASSMVKAKRLIQEEYSHIAVYGCSAHCLNLLIGDFMSEKTFHLVKEQASSVVKHVNNSQFLKATLVKIQKEKKMKVTSLKLPGKTRWGSIGFCAESLLENKFALKTLAISEEVDQYSSLNIRQIILDEDFWCGLQSLLDIVTPVIKWITILEGNSTSLSLVAEAFYEIKNTVVEKLKESPFSIEEDKNIRLYLKQRSLFSMRSIHYAANILDPNFNGKNLTLEQQLKGMKFIQDRISFLYGKSPKFPSILADLAAYRSETEIYSTAYLQSIRSTISADAWWKSFFTETPLSIIARSILTMPATSAATERSFSTFGRVHSIIRNRLTVKRAGQLTHVGYNLKFLMSKKKGRKQRRLHFCSEYWETSCNDPNRGVEGKDAEETEDLCEDSLLSDTFSEEDKLLSEDLSTLSLNESV